MVGSARKEAMDVKSDRLTSLPDDLIHKILSFISVKDAIGTSVLSTRWRFIWRTMPNLQFENLKFGHHISKFISNVLSHRNNQIQLSSVSLVLGRTVGDDEAVGRILNCAFAHKVQQLTVTRSPGKLVGCPLSYRLSYIATPTWDLPALTTLHLHHIQLSDDHDSTGKCIGFFSKFLNLKNLHLRRCTLVKGTKVLNICLPQLSNLTLEYIRSDMELEYVNVVAPQLKNLTMLSCDGKHLISAPGLVSLAMEGYHPWQLSTPGFPSLEKVDLRMYNISDADLHKIVCVLQQLRHAKLLILSLGIMKRLIQERKVYQEFLHLAGPLEDQITLHDSMLQVVFFIRSGSIEDILSHLSSSMELIPQTACVFANAKISRFTTKVPLKVYLEERGQEKGTMSTEIKNYENSHNVIFPLVSHEEIEAIGDMAAAQVFVKHLGWLLKQCNANTNSDTIKTHLDEHDKPQVKKHWESELQLNLVEMIALIKQSKFVASEICLMRAQCMSSRFGTIEIIAWLQEILSSFQCIKGWMTQLSASKGAVLQPNYSTLCEEAAIVTNSILGWMKTVKETQEMNALTI